MNAGKLFFIQQCCNNSHLCDVGANLDTGCKLSVDAFLPRENVNRKLDHKREKVSSHLDQVNNLKDEVNDLTTEKLRIEKDVQQRCGLEERKALLETENDTLALEIQVHVVWYASLEPRKP